MLKSTLRFLLKKLYRVEIKGLDNYKKAGDRVLIVANHTSFLDPVLIAAFLPEKLTFAVNTHIAKQWWMKPAMFLITAFPLDPLNPMATKSLIDEIKKDKKAVIFPEGRITVTGSLMKVYEGPGMIADKSTAKVLPIRIDGAQYTPFSRLKGKVRLHLFPKIRITVLEPVKFEVPDAIKGRARRKANGEKLYDIMTDMIFESSNYRRTIAQALIDARATHGGSHLIVDDVNRKPLSYDQLITRSYILGQKIKNGTKKGEYIGILLPNMASSIVTFFAAHLAGRIPAMLNFSTGVNNVVSACNTAKLKKVYTSKRFVQMARLEEMMSAIEASGVKVIYLEDIAKKISIIDKISGLTSSHLLSFKTSPAKADSAAVILFTSGSEGTPKGVVLSHKNLLANISQLASRVDFGPKDIVFNALPIFHSFGLTGGTLLPVLSGIRTFFYPSPLHYRIVPELVYDTNATILFGTDTFLSGYAKHAHPYDFYSIRYVFAGAEKLKDETRRLWSEKFGVRIFEGYGATETSPVLSTNTPMHNKPGTVGRIMPGITYTIEAVPGVEEGGKLVVSGPNIMKGYLLADNPGKLVAPEDNKYDTGDIVSFDEQGYITIKGRAKRFAKIAGEMVSLTAVETYLSELWPSYHHAVVAIADAKKGEQLVLVTNCSDAGREHIVKHVKQNGYAEISIPKQIKIVDKVPLLGTGKTDYVSIQKLAAS